MRDCLEFFEVELEDVSAVTLKKNQTQTLQLQNKTGVGANGAWGCTTLGAMCACKK